jgi:hypothetical protein
MRDESRELLDMVPIGELELPLLRENDFETLVQRIDKC